MEDNKALLAVAVAVLLVVLSKLKSVLVSKPKLHLPPGPWTLPVIGSIHHLVTSPVIYRKMRDLAQRYGPLMMLRLGEVPTLLVSSPEAAQAILKTHDITFADRHLNTTMNVLTHDGTDLVFGPYGERWRQLRKICALELLSVARVQSFRRIREEEVSRLLQSLAASGGAAVNLTKMVTKFINDTIVRESVGGRCKYQDEYLDALDTAVRQTSGLSVADLFPSSRLMQALGSAPRTVTLTWCMTELIRHPAAMAKAQAEVRDALKGRSTLTEDDLAGLSYLKLVLKEALRLHCPLPLLFARRCRETCQVMGYDIPKGTSVFINVWAICRDPKYWNDAEEFKPERFEKNNIDYKGTNYEFLPFGSGRRMCPGINLGIANIELALASLLYHFDWKLPSGVELKDVQISEASGLVGKKDTSLILHPATHVAPVNG